MTAAADHSTKTPVRTFMGLSGSDWGIVLIAVNNLVLPSVLPVVIGTLAKDVGLGLARAGYVSSIAGIAMVVGSLSFAFLVLHIRRGVLLTGGIGVMVAGFLLTLISPDFHWLVATRSLSGFGDGVAAAACYSLMAGGSNPSRLLAMYATGQGLTGVICMAFLPAMIVAFGWQSLFIFATIVAIPALIFAPAVARKHESAALVRQKATLLLPGKALANLLTLFLFFAGLAVTWSYLQPLGEMRGFETAGISFALTLSSMGQMVGPLLVALVAYRLSIRLSALAGAATIAIAVIALLLPSYIAFCAAIILLNLSWGFLFPFLFRGVTQADPTGRAASVTSVVTGSALAAATAIGGLLFERLGANSVIILGGVVAVLGLLLAAILHWRDGREQASES